MSSKNFYGLTGDVTVDGGILNVGNAQLYANTETSNVGIGTTNAEFKLDVRGDANVHNLYATYLHGDGSNIENIVSSQWEGSPGDPIYYESNVGIANTSPVTTTMQIGSNVVIDDVGSNVLHVTGNVYADYFVGDGSQLTGIAASLDQIVDQGNTVSNTIQIEAGQDATSNVGLVTWEGVGISVSNANPTGEFQFGVGSNLLVNVYSSNVLTVDGNVFAQKMTLGTVTVTPAYNLQQITTTGATTNQTLVLDNATTGLTTTSNVGIANTAPVHTLDVGSNLYVEDTGSNVLTVVGNVSVSGDLNVGSNLYVTERLDVGSNLHIENLRVAEVASNLVTYDSTTGELMDSGGLFSNKLAVVSEQPPIALTGASTVVTNHGTYTIEASSGTVVNLFDKVIGESNKWVTDENYSTTEGDEGTYEGSASLAGHEGEWVKITMPYKTILRHVKIESTNQSVEDIELVGLNADGLTWTPLKTETGLTGTTHTIIVNATTHHRTYGLIVEKTNTTIGRSTVEIGDLKLFTESFSIDGGKVEMATSAVMGGETTMDQHGPHSRDPKAVPLKKYPEIVFEEGKFDSNDSTNTYIQAGYTVTASSQVNLSTFRPWNTFDGNIGNEGWHSYAEPDSFSGESFSYDGTSSLGSISGAWLKLELPHKIRLSYIDLLPRAYPDQQEPKDFKILGSNDDTNWVELIDVVGATWTHGTVPENLRRKFSVTGEVQAYKYLAISVSRVVGSTVVILSDLKYYGYEEDPPAGDTSIDTTFTSIMNTPQTTGAKVYTDAKLSSDFTNRVTGPTVSNTHTTYVSAEKYWELSGNVESNVTIEANTFLSGDQPHAVSVWFNSSNLEANVSNTCVFSVSDQEKLDSVNLDLQSNTWHNLTYAYQGEGGSRVTYLDGRKVAEDQAEDTFGEYPPFAMTGYSQGGYVVSSNFESATEERKSYNAFNAVGTGNRWQVDSGYSTSGDFLAVAVNGLLPSITDTNGTAHVGHWLKLELPHKLRLNRFKTTNYIHPQYQLKSYVILGSNDDVNWTLLHSEADANLAGGESGGTHDTGISGVTESFKYLKLLVKSKANGSSDTLMVQQVIFYGHRENDLVRLPDPTNVLKYPHIAMTGPAQRGYVATASSEYPNSVYPAWKAFNEDNSGSSTGWLSQNVANLYNPTYNTGVASSRLHSSTPYGEYVILTLPHKLLMTKISILGRNTGTPEVPRSFKIYGSDTGTSWNEVLDVVDNTNINTSTFTTIDADTSTTAYNQFAIVITKTAGTTAYVGIGDWELYGTGVDSIPIQIGGGNIDKVANFRVYDTFIGEDQALEIWDAQKDEFGRAKSSMTLHKGRLGIGTTEPEGRLAVADEPHNLEEFPPGAMSGYDTYFEGHGVFKASASSYYINSDTYAAWRAFNQDDATFWVSDDTDTPETYDQTTGLYTGTRRLSEESVLGEYIILKLPYSINLKSFTMGVRSTELLRGPESGIVYGRRNNNWEVVHSFSGVTYTSSLRQNIQVTHPNEYYNEFALVTTSLAPNGSTYHNINLTELRYFGTREQGQSVLHDGQLTLTKNLNVPRIGPALDADDTPRRDRLVVEYNTSTNPTFEGAVRDTSGRGLDGVFTTGADYDATEKALTFNGATTSGITVGGATGVGGDKPFSIGLWFNMTSYTSGGANSLVTFGNQSTNAQLLLTIDQSTGLIYGQFFGASVSIPISGGVQLGKWYHFVLSYPGGGHFNMSLYSNGVKGTNTEYGGNVPGLIPQNATIEIGRYASSGNPGFNGKMSSFKFYDTALTAEEVKTLYDMGRCDEGHHVVNFSKTRVGIGLGDGEAPHDELEIRGNVRGSDNVIIGPYSGQWWRLYTYQNNGNLGFLGEDGTEHGYLVDSGTVNIIDFTGQHRAVIDKVNVSDYENFEGLIVSANKNKYINVDKDITTGSNAIQISQSLPLVSLSNVVHDKACYGVIAGSEDIESRTYEQGTFVSVFQKQKGDTRAYINSVGEGAIWVVNTNGSLESGDYITTSNVAGYGQKQDDDVLHNYTVAKITMDCDFNPATQPVQQILRSNVVQTYYLGNVHKVKNVPHEFVTTTVGADDAWSNVSVKPPDVTYAEWSNLEANTQNTYTLTYTQTSNVVYDTKYTLTTTANVTESDSWDKVFVDPPDVSYAEYSNLEANTQNTYTLTFTQTTTDEKTPDEWSTLESNVQSLYNKVYYQSVEEEVAATWPGATTHTRVTDVIENELDEHGQIQWEDHATETEKAYKIRYLDASGAQTDEANAVHIAAFVGCTYHCG